MSAMPASVPPGNGFSKERTFLAYSAFCTWRCYRSRETNDEPWAGLCAGDNATILCMPKTRLCLCLGPILFCLLDGCLTLRGQSEEYWSGNYRLAEELNPLGLWALEKHPLVFAAVLLGWIGFFSVCILALPKNLAMVFSFLIQMGHTLGSCSWAIRDYGWLACIPLLIASRLVLDLTWKERVAAERIYYLQ
jgi:hypothetical protein